MGNYLSNKEPQILNTVTAGHRYCLSFYGCYDKRQHRGNSKQRKLRKKLRKKFRKCVQQFSVYKDPSKINELISMINQLQIEKKIKEENTLWISFLESGWTFLLFLRDFVEMDSLDKAISSTAVKLHLEGEALSIVGGLSMTANLLSQIDKITEHQSECFELLRDMFYLAQHVNSFTDTIPKDKFISAIELIVQGSIYCASLLQTENSISFAKGLCNLEGFSSIRRKVNKLFSEPVSPHHPVGIVGIEKPVNDIVDLLRRRPTEESSLAVVIYGFGGTGKTTLAEVVLTKINLHHYNYTRVALYQEEENDLKSLQQQILKDCFPIYYNSKPIELKDCKDGREQLEKAFQFQQGKPVFLFIDNASRSLDLKDLLPTKVFLPRGSRILLTTRRLVATNMFEKLPDLERKTYSLDPLALRDAWKILFPDTSKCGNIENVYSVRILKICGGVPLALKIVSAHLHKQRILWEALEKGGEIKEEKLSNCLIDFVYGELDNSTQEAFLDICCFFSNWKRQDVEYIVGETAVTSLIRSGLITSIATQDILYFEDADEELILHDIIIAKGRSLAKGKRIMDIQSLCEAADKEKLDQIKGIWLTKDKSNYVFQERHLRSMGKSLRVLALGDRMKFSKANDMEFKELRFLRIGGCIPQLPLKLEALNNLKVFHGPFSIRDEVIMYELPTGLLAMKVAEQCIDNKSKSPEVEGVLQCHKLEKLHFTGSRELRKLLEGSNKLDALKCFILDDFTTIEELPDRICRLPALSLLSITKSSSLEYLPESLTQLTTLKQLRLSNFWALKALPSTFGQLRALTHLDLEGCCTLEDFPSNFELRALTHLSLKGCKSFKTLPENFGRLTALKYLNLSSCEKLQALPVTFGALAALKHLNLEHCTMLKALPSNFVQLTALEYLNLCYCDKLEALPFDREELKALKCLECSPELVGKVKDQIREEVLCVAY